MGKDARLLNAEQLRKLSKLAGKVNAVNLFPRYLLKHGYTQTEPNLFSKGDQELIQIRKENNHFTYVNHLTPGDKGGFINFLAIRLNDGRTGFSIDHYTDAAKIAYKLYEKHVKHERKIGEIPALGAGKKR